MVILARRQVDVALLAGDAAAAAADVGGCHGYSADDDPVNRRPRDAATSQSSNARPVLDQSPLPDTTTVGSTGGYNISRTRKNIDRPS